MEMESTGRAFDRSLSKGGLKKPRLIEDPTASDRISNGRAGFVQRPGISGSGAGVGLRAQRDGDSESSDSIRGPYQNQQLHHELVTQYKTALAELTFNSKPIITNLTIIAGESLHAAKAIAATVCNNIIEVPREQKLPSLYLLDSIVKNIGRDYIKHFAPRLPEVFCKAYRQVDPSIHSGMRHLFGTWKGVFPPQTLQMIEKELGLATTASGSSTGSASRPDSQSQRPAHSIHVNPKYLEARQRLQTTKASEAGSDTSGSLVNSHEDAEALERTVSISSGKSWADPYAKPIQHHQRDPVHEPVRGKSSSVAYTDPGYGSSLSGRSGLGPGLVVEKLKEPGHDRPWHGSDSDMTGISLQKNGFGLKRGYESYASESANSDLDLQVKQNIASGNWKNSEEEEFMWDDMNPRPAAHSVSTYDRMDFNSYLRRPQNIHEFGPKDGDEASSDSLSIDFSQVTPGTQVPSWSQKLHQPEGRMLPGAGKNISAYSEGYPTGLKSTQSPVNRTQSQPLVSPAHIGGPSLKWTNVGQPKVPTPQPLQTQMHQRPPSPSLSSPNLNQLLHKFAERNQTSSGPPKDPRRPPGHKSTVSVEQISEDSLPLPLQNNVYQPNTQRLQPQTGRSSSSLKPPIQQHRKHAPPPQRNLEVSSSQVSGSESRNSSSDQSNALTVDSPGKSITSNPLDAILKSGILSNSSITGSLTKPGSQFHPRTAPPTFPQKKIEPLSPDQKPTAVTSTSNPVSSLLSSLVAKGLISSSKSDSLKISAQPLDRGPGIASTSSAPVSSVPKPISPVKIKEEPCSSDPPAKTKSTDFIPPSAEKIKPLIGFEFRPDVVRNFNPDVISDLLSDLPHECSICGLKLKLQERLERHMEWHAARDPEQTTSRRWYANLGDWVTGIGHFDPDSDVLGDPDETLENNEPMVPADESQCACILCGELFEDFYSHEKDEWIFKGAVYLTVPSEAPPEEMGTSTSNNDANPSPLVHADCISEDSFRVLGLARDVKMENNA